MERRGKGRDGASSTTSPVLFTTRYFARRFCPEPTMSDTSSPAALPAPTVDTSGFGEIAEQVFVIPDRRVPLVPNIGLIGGRDAVLVVDTGMGPANGTRVLEAARDMAKGRKLILTITHFHPEHGFG